MTKCKSLLFFVVLLGCGTEEDSYLKEKRSCLLGKPGKAICINDLDKSSCDRFNGTHGTQLLLGCDLKNSGTCKVLEYEVVFLGEISDSSKEKWCSEATFNQ